MLLRRITDFLLQNRVQAMAAAFIIAFLPVIGSMGMLIAAFVTLRRGIVEGALVTLAASIPYLITYASSQPVEGQAQLVWVLMLIAVFSNVLTWILAATLRQFSHWNITLEIAALMGVIIIVLVHLIHPDIQSWWANQLNILFTKTVDAAGKLSLDPAGSSASIKTAQLKAVNNVEPFATGFLVVSRLFNALIQLAMARWWQAIIFNPGGLRKELYDIRLSYAAGAIYCIFLVLAYMNIGFGLDALPVMCGVFFVAGLSLVHWRLGLRKHSWSWLLLVYMGVILLFPFSFILVSVIALLDTGIDFRKRSKMIKR